MLLSLPVNKMNKSGEATDIMITTHKCLLFLKRTEYVVKIIRECVKGLVHPKITTVIIYSSFQTMSELSL